MFNNLSEKLQNAMSKLSSSRKLSETDIQEPLKEIRRALLGADVNFKVAKEFIESIRIKALEEKTDEHVTARTKVMRIVSEGLRELLGGSDTKMNINPKSPTVIMLVGLQGAGKTTTAGKIARFFKTKKNKKNLLVAADIYRPAAIKQLEIVAGQAEAHFFSMESEVSPVKIAQEGLEKAKYLGCDVAIIDTAGRLHIDEKLMDELKNIKEAVHPDEILLVVDAMTGQDAVNVATAFDKAIGITGLIFTKLDGDARGGAVLSIKSVTGKPIKMICTGEKLDDIEEFHPDRMASRILGMGDLATFVETVKENLSDNDSDGSLNKVGIDKFDLEDFLEYLHKIKKLGSMKSLLKMLPGINSNMIDDINEDQLKSVEAIIQSMTKKERRNPEIIKFSRKKRIANGCGKSLQEVNVMLKKFEELKKTMKLMKNKSKHINKKGTKFPFLQKT